MNYITDERADIMVIEFKAVLKLILKLLELNNIKEAKETIRDILKEE